jgi:predicted PurR-regulated permease PerM
VLPAKNGSAGASPSLKVICQTQLGFANMPPMARIVSLSVLTVLIVFLGIMFFQVIAPFLLPLFLAGVLAVLCRPVYRYFLMKTKGRSRLSAGFTTVSVLAVFLIPMLVGTLIASMQLFTLAQDTLGGRSWKKAVRTLRTELEIDSLAKRLQPHVAGKSVPVESVGDNGEQPGQGEDEKQAPSQNAPDHSGLQAVDGSDNMDEAGSEHVDELQAELEAYLKTALKAIARQTMGAAGAVVGAAPGIAVGFLGSVISALVSSLMFVIALYYFLADGPSLLSAAEGLIPVHVDYQRQLLARFEKVVRSVVIATMLAAVVQGLMTGIALSFCGFGHFFILSLVATFAALIPLAGTWLVWGPCALWLAYQGHWGTATLLTLFGAGVIGMIDNAIRTFVLQSGAKLHPLLAFVSVLGGLQAMGLWGVLIGPTVASCLHALIQIFNTELKEFSKSKFAIVKDHPAQIPQPDSDSEAKPGNKDS